MTTQYSNFTGYGGGNSSSFSLGAPNFGYFNYLKPKVNMPVQASNGIPWVLPNLSNPNFALNQAYKHQQSMAYSKRNMARQTKASQYVNPFTDPYAINSLSDVFLNSAAKDRKYQNLVDGGNIFSDALNWVAKTTTATFDYAKEQYVNPIMEGDFSTVLKNSIHAMGEDVDVPGNAIKGMVVESGMNTGAGFAIGTVGAGVAIGALLLSGPVGWGTLLLGGLTGAGLSVTGASIINDADKAVTGFQRGLGLTDEGKYNYRIETGNPITDFVSNMALDPMTWLTFGTNMAAKSTSDALKSFVSVESRARYSPSIKELWNHSETIADKLFVGGRAIKQVERGWGKLATNATPLGAVFTGTKAVVRPLTASALNSIKIRNSIKKGIDPNIPTIEVTKKGQFKTFTGEKFDALDIKEFTKPVQGGATNPIELGEKVSKLQSLNNDTRIVENLYEDVSKIKGLADTGWVPEDLTQFRDYVQALKEGYIESSGLGSITYQGGSVVETALVEDLTQTIRQGKFIDNPAFSEVNEFLKRGVYLPEETVRKFATDIVAGNTGTDFLVAEMQATARIFDLELGKRMEKVTTDLEIMTAMQETLSSIWGVEDSKVVDAIMTTMNGSHNLSTYYQPLWDQMHKYLDQSNIPVSDFMKFVKGDPSFFPSLTDKATSLYVANTIPSAPVTDRLIKDYVPESMSRALIDVKDLPEYIAKASPSVLQDFGRIVPREDFFANQFYETVFKNPLVTEQRGALLHGLNTLNDNLQTLQDMGYRISGDAYTSLKTLGSYTTPYIQAFDDIYHASYTVSQLSDSFGIDPSVYHNSTGPAERLKMLEDTIKSNPDYYISPTQLSLIDDAKKVFNDFDFYSSMVDRGSLVEAKLNEHYQSIIKDLVVQNAPEDLINSVYETISSAQQTYDFGMPIKESLGFVENIPDHFLYNIQTNKNLQYLDVLNTTYLNHKDLIDGFKDPNSALNNLTEIIKQVETTPGAFVASNIENVKHSLQHIKDTAFGSELYANYLGSIKRIQDLNGLGDSSYTIAIDTLTKYHGANMSPESFYQNIISDNSTVLKDLRDRLRYDGVPEHIIPQFENILIDYAEKATIQGLPNIIELMGTGTYDAINTVFSYQIPAMFDHIVDASRFHYDFKGLETLANSSVASVTGIKQAQNEFLSNYVFLNERDPEMSLLNRMPSPLGFKNFRNVNDTFVANQRVSRTTPFIPKKKKLPTGDFLSLEESLKKRAEKTTYEYYERNVFDALGSLEMPQSEYFDEFAREFAESLEYEFHALNEYVVNDKNARALSALSRDFNTQAHIQNTINKTLAEMPFDLENSAYTKSSLTDVMFDNQRAFDQLSVDEVAHYIKYSTPGVLMGRLDWKTRFYSPQELEYLSSKYGLAYKESNGMYAFYNVLETKGWTGLKKDLTNKLYSAPEGIRSRSFYNPKSTELLNELNMTAGGAMGVPMTFSADSYAPVRYDFETTSAFVSSSSVLKELVPQHVWDDVLQKLPRSRGYEQMIIADYDFLKNFVGVHPESGVSYLSQKPMKLAYNSAFDAAKRTVNKASMINNVLDPRMSAKTLFGDMSPKDAYKVYKNTDGMTLAVLNNNYQMRELKIKSEGQMAKALQSNAVVLNVNSFKHMSKIVNNKLEDLPGGKMFDLVRKLMAPFNASAITSIGFNVRNAFDTAYKNEVMFGTGTFEYIPRSREVLADYHEVSKHLGGDLNDFSAMKFLEEKYGNNAGLLAKKKFSYNVVSKHMDFAGIQDDLAVAARTAKYKANQKKTIPTRIQQMSYNNPVTKFILDRTTDMENVLRLAPLLKELDEGNTVVGALSKIDRTHFDYGYKTVPELYLSAIMPFLTFGLRNFEMWSENMHENMSMLRPLVLMIQENYTEDDQKVKSMEKNPNGFVANAMMSGNPLYQTGQYSTLIKLNPSLFDAFSFLPGLVEDPTQKLASPIRDGINVATGQISSWDQLSYPGKTQINRAAKLLTETLPKSFSGEDEDWRFLAAIIPSFASVTKFEPFEKKKYPKKEYGNRKQPYAPRPVRSTYRRSTPSKFANKEFNRVKYGNMRGSGGVPNKYGNPAYLRRQYNDDMHIRFSKGNPWLANAPTGVYLNRPYYGRSVYNKHYSASGKSRMLNRVRQFNDPRGLMFTMQDMRYNVF